MKLLIAEDTVTVQSLLSALMAEWGYDHDLAIDGAEAITYARRKPGEYDLCIMDVEMPRVNGLDATRTSRRAVDYFPILGYSTDERLHQRCLESGMDGFLSKLSKPEQLRAAIDEMTPKLLLVSWESELITVEKAKPTDPEELRELQALRKNGLTKLKLAGLERSFIVQQTNSRPER